MKKIVSIIIILCFALVSLSASRIIIMGKTTPSEIFLLKSWKTIYNDYTPDIKTIKKISSLNKKLKVEIYFGTWCKDSRNNVPKLIKIFENLPDFKVEYTGIIWRTCDKTGLYKKYNLERVPTIIFYQGEKEIGRIIENPKKTLEKDILNIVSNN